MTENLKLTAYEFIPLLAEGQFGVALVSVGLAFAVTDIVLRTELPNEWAAPEFIGLIAFAGLQVVFGSLERLVFARSERNVKSAGANKP
jgi:hypothetical protein